MKQNMGFAFMGLVLIAGLTGCASTPKARPTTPSRTSDVPSTYKSTPDGPIIVKEDPNAPLNIDYFGLQKSLGLSRDDRKLGYSEKAFATCEAGYGFPSSRDCQRNYFTVIHFHLLCRESEGTVQTPLDSDDMRPLSRSTVNWTLASDSGEITLDDQGYGQIRSVQKNSPKTLRLKISVGNDFLYMRAGEISKVVAPAPFCP